MSLFESASLVVTPNGIKASKLYAIKPTDGSGDLSVVRATTARRFNSDGLIEQVPYNLFTYSEEFNNAYWSKVDVSINSNVINSPNGTLTADKLVENTANNVHLVNTPNASVPTGTNTLSVYAKADTRNWILLYLFDGVLGSLTAYFNVSNGTLGNVPSGLTASIDSVGNGWYRCSITRNQANSGNGGYGLASADNVASYAGNGTSGAYFWGAQLVSGTSAKEYFPTTDRLNIPRLDYTNGSCPSILVEPQRTNLVLYSEEFDNAYWSKIGTSISANNVIAPDGTLTADTMEISASTSRMLPTLTTGSGTYTVSCYIKRLTGTADFQFRLVTDGANQIQNITITEEWQRYDFTVTAITSITQIQFRSGGGTGNIAIWGAQLEAGSYATSYIPTTSASVTRNADVISKTGISSLIGTEFTLFYDGYEAASGVSTRYLILKGSGGTYENLIILESSSLNRISVTIKNNAGGNEFFAISNSLTNGQRVKIGIRCKNNDFSFYLNGVELYTQLSGSVPVTSSLYLGYYTDNSDNYTRVNSTAIFPIGLTNTELANLTTI